MGRVIQPSVPNRRFCSGMFALFGANIAACSVLTRNGREHEQTLGVRPEQFENVRSCSGCSAGSLEGTNTPPLGGVFAPRPVFGAGCSE